MRLLLYEHRVGMNSQNQKRIVVVLGMHRSGTSALTRALVAIGAGVGDNLLPAGHDNPRGFWEDKDFVTLNDRLLAMLNGGFDSLALLPEGFERRTDVRELQLEAVLMLREKLQGNDLFAIKDPRTCRLLPFWQPVFQHLDLSVTYVVAVRHPLSVADSLSARNQFPKRKSLWLWLQHYAAAINNTQDAPRLFIDYDQLLAAPQQQLQRIASRLELAADNEAAVRDYIDNFLSLDLRHAAYTPEDVQLFQGMPEPVVQAYRSLLAAAADAESVDFAADWQAVGKALEQQHGMLDFLQEYDRLCQQLNTELQAASQQLESSAQQSERERLEHQEAHNRLEQRLMAETTRLNDLLAVERGRFGEFRDKAARELDDLRTQTAREKIEAVQASQNEINRLQAQLSHAENELRIFRDSNSMRITAPARALVRLLGRTASPHQAKTSLRIGLAKVDQLLARSGFILRQEGPISFCRRTVGYVSRSVRRRLTIKEAERYLPVAAANTGTPPLVSFVTPIYDRTDVLRQTIQSALAQTLPVFEVILVTDGSPAPTMAVVEEFRNDPRVRIFSYPVSSGNAVRGRNKGILEARGRYIAFLDSDDLAAPDRLEVCLPLLESGQADVVYGSWRAKLDGTREIDGLVDGQVVHSPNCNLDMLLKVCVPCQSTVMVRRDSLLKAGFLKPRMEYREDHELWARLAFYGARFKTIEHVLTDLRLHAGNNELNFKDNDGHWEALLAREYRVQGPRPKKIAFILACLGISGGAAVVLRHVSMLIEQGHDAFIISLSNEGSIEWFGNPAIRVYRLDELSRCGADNIDLLFATFWTTVDWLERIPARRKLYFVQSDERLFYEEDAVKAQVAATYQGSHEYVAIAQWICNMLRNEYGQKAVHYVPNGLDQEMFYPDSPLQEKNPERPRVLIEGPISVPFKGMAEAYEAIKDLDCEIWIVSSSGRPEAHWRYDRFFQSVNHAEMRHIYSSCDILLKMSRVESFAYPPLEAMACGCAVVLGEVKGGVEYAEDNVNLLKVEAGSVDQGRQAVARLMAGESLRKRLQLAGYETVRNWSWEASSEAMAAVLSADDDKVAPGAAVEVRNTVA